MTALLPIRTVVVLVLIAGTMTGCRRYVDLVAALEPVEVTTGWFDAGIVDGKNKLVPSITLQLRNRSNEPLRSVQINAIFRRVGEAEMWGEHFGWAVQRDELAPGATTDVLVMRSALGYTGEQPRMQILQNSQFVDAKVELYVRRGAQSWVKLAEYPIQRQLLTN